MGRDDINATVGRMVSSSMLGILDSNSTVVIFTVAGATFALAQRQKAIMRRLENIGKVIEQALNKIEKVGTDLENISAIKAHVSDEDEYWKKSLLYLADRGSADYIISMRRLEIAKHRTGLYMSDDLHMCQAEGCENPVVGKKIFAHCEAHLTEQEKRWLDEDLETNGFAGRKNKKPLDEAFECLEKGDIEDAIKKKSAILGTAFRQVAEHDEETNDRWRYLPSDLRDRLMDFEASLIDRSD